MPAKKTLTKVFIKQLMKNPEAVVRTLSPDDIAKIIQEANHYYCNSGNPLIPDQTYDIVFDYLKSIEPGHPVLKQVGACVAPNDARKERLPYYMGSLDKIKNNDPTALAKFKSKYTGSYVISDKLDGNSALLVINENGVKLFTRGDGNVGQNITGILNYIKGIPNGLESKAIKSGGPIAVRGELIISREDFAKVAHKGANARNMVAGVINAKLPDISILQLVQFVAYEQIFPDTLTIDNQLKNLKCMGFRVVYNELLNDKDLSEARLSDILVKRRADSPFEVDGIVIFHAGRIHKRSVGENPDYAFAFKSLQAMEKAEVVVSKVEWNISKDGYMIPVIMFPPTALNGVTIQRSHGFNGKFIKDNKIGPGSRIVIMRSGDVIPYVAEVLSASTAGDGQMPEIPFEWSTSGVDIIAKGDDANSQVQLKSLEYFFDKIDVKGVSAGIIKKLFDAGYKTPKAIFQASLDDFKTIDGFKDKMAQKVFDALKDRLVSLNTDCVLLMDASNTMGRGMGSKKIELIVGTIPRILTEKYVPSVAELVAIKGIEKKTAEQFIQNLPACFKFIEDNEFGCVSRQSPLSSPNQYLSSSPTLASCKLAGLNVVFTGVRNKEVEAFILNNGGKVSSTVSKNTTLVIAKDPASTSNSVTKARELGIKVVGIDSFIKENGLPMTV